LIKLSVTWGVTGTHPFEKGLYELLKLPRWGIDGRLEMTKRLDFGKIGGSVVAL
jgi:hypothetical protein